MFPRLPHRRTFTRVLVYICVVYLSVDLLRYLSLYPLSPGQAVHSHKGPKRIYIVGIHWNSEQALRDYWNDQIVQLADHFGPVNVYVSVYESGSFDNSKDALKELESKLNILGVPNTIILEPTTHADEISKPPAGPGYVHGPDGQTMLRRISYLSKCRNRALEPLVQLGKAGARFDRVLFLNDVVFSLKDVDALLSTHDGDYAAACSLDFSDKAPDFYDTFALRDSQGHEAVMPKWPYFRSAASRSALISGKPVPLRSCWNGIVAMDPAPFYDSELHLRFRGIPDSLADLHLEGSECCLIHVDNPLSAKRGVWLNPDVRVGYSRAAYDRMHSGDAPRSAWSYMIRIWENRLRRWLTSDYIKRYRVQLRMSRWRKAKDSLDGDEKGLDCIINEMQILDANGWLHI